MNKKTCALILTSLGFVSALFFNNNFAETKADSYTAEAFLNKDNWKILPGYEYKTAGHQTDDGQAIPPEITFPESTDSTGINMKIKGYYSSGTGDATGKCYSGMVYKNKVKLEDVSVTFFVNSQGANEGASPKDDGWVSVSFLQNCNGFSTTNAKINSGTTVLCRSFTRNANIEAHEVVDDEKTGTKLSTFGTGSSVYCALDTYPTFEGSTVRISFKKESAATGDSYYLVTDCIDFETKEIVATKTSKNPLVAPGSYLDADGKGYLAISASTDNFDKKWDFSIKNINGVDVGTKADVAPLTAEEKAANVYALIDELNVYSYFNIDGTMKNEGKDIYTPDNTEMDVETLMTDLSVQLYNLGSDGLDALVNQDPVSANFNTANEYKDFLDKCLKAIQDNFEGIKAQQIVTVVNKLVSELPKLNNVTLDNEPVVTNIVNGLQKYYKKMNEKVIALYGQSNYESLWNDTIVPFSKKLDGLRIDKLESLAGKLTNTVTKDNIESVLSNLIPAEKTYAIIEPFLETYAVESPTYKTRVDAVSPSITSCRSAVNTFASSNRALVDDLETVFTVKYEIDYISNPVTIDDTKKLFDTLSLYNSLDSELKEKITNIDLLTTACAKALVISISAMPDASKITQSNYLIKGYDTLVATLNTYYQTLRRANSEKTKEVTNYEKLQKAVGKLSALQNPLSNNLVDPFTLDAKEEKVIRFVDLFNNYDGRNYKVESNYGVVSYEGETLTLSFKDGGEYNVSVTITDLDYNQTSTNTFKVTVNAAAPEKTGGCGGSVLVSSLFGSLLLLGATSLLLKKKHEN